MFFNKNKNRHPAAAGRFASYGEIVSNFACFVYNSKILEQGKAGRRSKNFYYFFAVSAMSLILALIITMSLNAAAPSFFAYSGSPLAISEEYLTLWVILFFILIFAGNKINRSADMMRGGFKFSDKNTAAGFRRDKSFELGILKGSGDKKEPDVLIGLDEKKRCEHTLIVSPTGGGKTSRYIVPGIAADAEYSGASVVAIDIDSPYLYGAVKSSWIKAGKNVVHFDPYDYESYDGRKKIYFNPLLGKDKNPLSDEKLLDLSSMLFHLDRSEIKGGDVHAYKYYSKRSSDLFYACLVYLKYKYAAKYFDLPTVKSFFERGVKFIEGEILKFNGENAKNIKNLFNNFLELPVYERAKVITDILNNLDFLNDPQAASRFKYKEGEDCFFTEDFFAKDMLFIAGIPKEKINSGGGRLISFITQIFIDGIYENRRKALREENPDSRSFFIYLDEFPVLTLNDFDTELANLRKTNAGVCLTVQDTAFLKDRWGDISLITSNIGTHIVMGHAGWETCKYYSEMSGEKYVFHKEPVRKHNGLISAVFSADASAVYGETPVASGLYPLISPDELKNMDGNSVFIYTKYVNPFILNLK